MLVAKFRRHSRTGRPVAISGVIQTWWVVEKCVESPESDRVFRDVVGVVREKVKDLKRGYEQRSVHVLTDTERSRKGIALNYKPQFGIGLHEVLLSPVDYDHSVFPGWD
ncbi:MAG: hypothetical protein RIQ41_386 [Candidatus Parcubacteria bacterium]|jgi:hypothetical protein